MNRIIAVILLMVIAPVIHGSHDSFVVSAQLKFIDSTRMASGLRMSLITAQGNAIVQHMKRNVQVQWTSNNPLVENFQFDVAAEINKTPAVALRNNQQSVDEFWKDAVLITALVVIAALIVALTRAHKQKIKFQAETAFCEEKSPNFIASVKQHEQTASADDKERSIFLANMSHEIRTPLNAIVGYSDLVKEDILLSRRSDSITHIDKVLESARNLQSLIEGVSQVSKLEEGRLRLKIESFSVSEMLNSILMQARKFAARNNNQIQYNAEITLDNIETDRYRLQQAILSVLSNSCQLTKNGIVTLDVNCEFSNGQTWYVFQVADNGERMPEEQQEQLFNIFVGSGVAVVRDDEGIGVGMALSRGYCRLMGGDIFLNKNKGEGNVMVVKIPAFIHVADHAKVSA